MRRAGKDRPVAGLQEPRLKRPFDFLLASLGLIFSSPLWVLVAFAIWLDSGRPVFYLQERLGWEGRRFIVWKFRSMAKDAEAGSGPVAATKNDHRVTKVGRILRNTGLDELPQLINILRGDMSFVGPRADRPWEMEKNDGDLFAGVGSPPDVNAASFSALIPNYHLRLSVRPGLTGLAQVYAKYDTPRRQKLRFDLLYIRKSGFWLDLKLILLGFWISLRADVESRSRKV